MHKKEPVRPGRRTVKNKVTPKEGMAGGSKFWIPFASYCTTGQFARLGRGYKSHCGPTAAVNLIRTLENCGPGTRPDWTDRELFLTCAEIGRRSRMYWNMEIFGCIGGTSNFLAPAYLRKCLRAAGLDHAFRVCFHLWITPDAVEDALMQGSIVLLQVYAHPKYKNHHMLCYACRRRRKQNDPAKNGNRKNVNRDTDTGDGREYLLADGFSPKPVWVSAGELGHGHFLTVTRT